MPLPVTYADVAAAARLLVVWRRRVVWSAARCSPSWSPCSVSPRRSPQPGARRPVPPFRQFSGYTATDEGWGLYAERLGKEAGLYQDPYSDMGRLNNEMWRAVRLVVDTGIHAQRWPRQQAIDYMLATVK